MSTSAVKGTKVKNDTSILASQQANGIHETLKRQLLCLLDATMRETWLPMGFRVLVVQEFPAMRAIVERKRIDFPALESLVANLLEEAEPHKVFAKRSASFLALRTLETDLRGSRIAA